MPLKLFDTQDLIPETHRDSAIETKDGKFAILEEEDTSSLKSALSVERKRADDAERERRKVERERAEEKQRLEAERLGKTEEELKALRADVRKELETEFAPLKDVKARYDAFLRESQLDNPAKALFVSEAVNGRGERQDAFWRLCGDRFDLTSDGKMMVKDHPGMPVDKYMTDVVKKEYPEFFKGAHGSGGSAPTAPTTEKPKADAPDKPPTQWSSDERRKYIEENGAESYRALLTAHMRAGMNKKD